MFLQVILRSKNNNFWNQLSFADKHYSTGRNNTKFEIFVASKKKNKRAKPFSQVNPVQNTFEFVEEAIWRIHQKLVHSQQHIVQIQEKREKLDDTVSISLKSRETDK